MKYRFSIHRKKNEVQKTAENPDTNSQSTTNYPTDLTEELIRDDSETSIPTIEAETSEEQKEAKPTVTLKLAQVFQREFIEYLIEKASKDPALRERLLSELRHADKNELLSIIETIISRLEKAEQSRQELEKELLKQLSNLFETSKQEKTQTRKSSTSTSEYEYLDL